MHSTRRSFTTTVLAISLMSPWMPLLNMLLVFHCPGHPLLPSSAGRALQAPQLSAGHALQAPQLSADRSPKEPQLLSLGRILTWAFILIGLLLHLGYVWTRSLTFVRFVSSSQMPVLAHPGCPLSPSAGRARQVPQLCAGRALQAPPPSAGRALQALQLLTLGRALTLLVRALVFVLHIRYQGRERILTLSKCLS